ncbi:MAG: GNAT family N-acetyltransferase [Deltaproteobacteria bacterium]|nr:GNAT family N-acetyltransferase [Deltaproteobacteria bacterium]
MTVRRDNEQRKLPRERKIAKPEKVLERIEPGMSIFISTGPSEPRALVKALAASDLPGLQDLELIQLVSLGDALSEEVLHHQKYRLKTFFSGYIAGEAIRRGRVDLIPARISNIPKLIESGTIRVDVAFIQVTPPDDAGYMSLGLAVDAARLAMERAELVVGEINAHIPRTLGDTLVHESEFDLFVASDIEPIHVARWPDDEAFDKVAENIAALVRDGACVAYSIGPLYDALARRLASKHDLGIHSPIIPDAVMDLIKSGAVTNRKKAIFRGKTLASWALGTPELLRWLDDNPLVEFQGIDITADPETIGANDNFLAILPARKADLTGRIALHFGKGNVAVGPAEAYDLLQGARVSRGGRTIVGLPSRNRTGSPNIVLSVDDYPNQVPTRESIDLIVTEYGAAYLSGRTVRERAQALVDVAHPDDREDLVRQAKEAHILYPDQMYLAASGHLYPQEVAATRTFKGDLVVRFRAIKPSDEEEMRRLFYRFSDKAVYYRYFSPIKTMPHKKMQSYVNVDYRRTLSVVGVVGDVGEERVIAEARYVRAKDSTYADIAFVVDEEYHGRGIATFLFHHLIQLAKERGIEGFTADVLATNKAMMKVFERSPHPIRARVNAGVYEIVLPFGEDAAAGNPIHFDR